jgi:hypothetical protein
MAGKKKDSKPEPYVENEDHVPNPMYQRGNVDTTGTTGDAGSSIDNITPVFAEARRDALGAAVEAIEDPNADEDRVVALPPEDLSREDAVQKVQDAAEEAENNPQLTEGLTPGAQDAAAEQEQSAPGRKSRSDSPAPKSTSKRAQSDSGNK